MWPKNGTKREKKLEKLLHQRMEHTHCKYLSNYAWQILKSRDQPSDELISLIEMLVNTETYFFRDKDQFNLLKNTLIPEMIVKNSNKKKLRIWSAGCASGKEVYSLAILVTQLIPKWKTWDIKIIGTDICSKAIKQAKNNSYSTNSLRLVEQKMLDCYFLKENENKFKVIAPIQRIVLFKQMNLYQDDFSLDKDLATTDLILYRNVFIYFQENAIYQVIKKFSKRLDNEGILM